MERKKILNGLLHQDMKLTRADSYITKSKEFNIFLRITEHEIVTRRQFVKILKKLQALNLQRLTGALSIYYFCFQIIKI